MYSFIDTLLVVFALALAGSLLMLLVIRILSRDELSREQWFWEEGMPWRLRHCKVVLNEQQIYTDGPLPMHGTPDQVLERANGDLVILDSKTRDRAEVFISDIIQMSVYRYILTHGYGRKVSPHGYVRLVQVKPGHKPKVKYKKVRLLGDLAMNHLWHEYTAISKGEFQAPCRCGGAFH